MKKVILSEEQVKRVIDKLLGEQQASEFKGGTDAQRIAHALLTKNFGLPDGANHENYYYGANITDVINVSGSGDRSKFLSVFKPANKYNEDPKGYLDSIYVNNESLQNSGTKAFRFVNGNVYATHNGLLALARAMDHMGGGGGVLTISFGSSTVGKEAQSERMGGSVKFDSNRALNQTPTIGMLEEILVALAVSPQFRNIGTFVSVRKELSNEQLISLLQVVIPNIAMGVYGFMDVSKKDEIIKTLTPKGFVTQIDFDVASFANKLIPLQKIEDKLPDEERGGQYVEYNRNKMNQLNSIGQSFEENLINLLKATYMKNFQIYVENYLPNSSTQIIPLIKNVRFNYRGLGEEHNSIFHRYVAGSSASTSSITQTNTNYKTGN
jgi:hypothetical protein